MEALRDGAHRSHGSFRSSHPKTTESVARQSPVRASETENAAIGGTRLFAGLVAVESRRALESTIAPARAVAAHADLVRERDRTDQIFILLDGWAGRYRTTRDGRRQIVGLALPGDVANLDTLEFARPDFGVRMLTPGTVTTISRDGARALAASDLEISNAFTRLGLIENAILSQWALCLGRKSAEQRLAHLFCELAIRIIGSVDGPIAYELPLTQEQLADALGLTSVHVNRMHKQLRGAGLIETAGRRVRLADPARLRELAEFDPSYLHREVMAGEAPMRRQTGNARR